MQTHKSHRLVHSPHDLGPTNAISGLSVVVANTTPAAAAETEVIVNDDGNAFVDFRVESGLIYISNSCRCIS